MTLQVVGASEVPTDAKLNAISRQTHITATSSQRLGMSGIPAGLHCYDTSLGLDFLWDGSNWILWGGHVRGELVVPTGTPQVVHTGPSYTDVVWVSAVENTSNFWPGGAHVLRIPYAGTYSITAAAYFTAPMGTAGAGGGGGGMKLTRGGSINDYINSAIPPTGVEHSIAWTGTFFQPNDTLKLSVVANTGGDIHCTARIVVTWVSP
jgi:hypothetical protein